MPLPKDAPMACEPENQAVFLRTLNVLRADCIHLLEVHEHDIPDRYWRPGYPVTQTPPRTAKDRSRLKVCLTVTFNSDRKPIFPPPNTRLSDELVYLATKFLSNCERADAYPYDFDVKGDINPDRIPSGVAPLVWAHGLPFFPVYKGYYILCGRKRAKWIGWLLNRQDRATMTRYPMWTIGPVVAPASAVEMSRTIEREERRVAARDVVSTCHCDLSVVPRTPDVSGGYRVMPLYQVLGYNVQCGPDWDESRPAAAVDRQVFVQAGVDFDYSAALARPLVNQRCPLAEPVETGKHDGGLEGVEALDELSRGEAQDPVHQKIENQGNAVSPSEGNLVKDNVSPQTEDFTKQVQACENELNELARAITDIDTDSFDSRTKMEPVRWWLDSAQRSVRTLKSEMARVREEPKRSNDSDLPPRKRLKTNTPCARQLEEKDEEVMPISQEQTKRPRKRVKKGTPCAGRIDEKAGKTVSISSDQAKPSLDASPEIRSSADEPLVPLYASRVDEKAEEATSIPEDQTKQPLDASPEIRGSADMTLLSPYARQIEDKAEKAVSISEEQIKLSLDASPEIQNSADISLLPPCTSQIEEKPLQEETASISQEQAKPSLDASPEIQSSAAPLHLPYASQIKDKAEEAVSIAQEQTKLSLDASPEIQSSADEPLLPPPTEKTKISTQDYVTENVPREINANEAFPTLDLPDQETKTVTEDTEMVMDIHDPRDENVEHAQEPAGEIVPVIEGKAIQDEMVLPEDAGEFTAEDRRV